MLNDDELMKLNGIQHQLFDQDPAFVADFQTRVRRLPRRDPSSAARSRVYLVLMCVVMVLGLLQLIDGEVGGAIFMATIAGGAYIARHFDSRLVRPS